MKKYFLLCTSLSFLLLAACSKDEVTSAPIEAPTAQDTASPTRTTSTNELFHFTKFDVDVTYDERTSFEVEYENESSGVEAKIEDGLNNEVIHGNNAYTKLEPIFTDFIFISSTPDEDIMQEVIKAFNLPDNYIEFEIEIDFTDGIKKEFTIRK